MAIFWPFSLFMNGWKSYCAVPLILCPWAPSWAWPDCCWGAPSTGGDWNWTPRVDLKRCPPWVEKNSRKNRDIITKDGKLFHGFLLFFIEESPFLLQHNARKYLLRVHGGELSAVQTLSPTVKSGPHQTWICPQHASRISLFVLQMLYCLGWKGSIVVIAVFICFAFLSCFSSHGHTSYLL